MAENIESFCRNCGALCSMIVTVEEGRIIGVAPDGTASPYGAYLCPKGLASADFHNGAEDRLYESQKRGGDGSFSPISADRALDEIAEKLNSLVATYGPRSIALYQGTGGYRTALGNLMQRAFRAALGTPNFYTSMTIDQSAKLVTWGRMGLMASGKRRLEDVDLAVIVGNNPVVSHQTYPFAPGESGAPGRALADAKARGTRVIIVDPRRTETARYAD